ncbi:hypothetical protein WMF41_50440 [Sorangium sp. So ce1151]
MIRPSRRAGSTGAFSKTSRLWNIGCPRSISLQRWMSTSGVCSCCRSSRFLWRSAASHGRSGASAGTGTRSGSVLMKRPRMDSTPGSSGGRPATVTPKSTSRSPL